MHHAKVSKQEEKIKKEKKKEKEGTMFGWLGLFTYHFNVMKNY